MGIRTRSRRSIGAVPADPGYHVGPATQQPNSCFHVRIERRLVVLRSIWSGDHRAPVAQRIERRPPEPDRLSVVAALVGPRAKRAEFYALREALRGFARPPVFRLLAWRHTFKPMLCIAKAGLEPAPSRIYCYRGLPPAIATVGTACGHPTLFASTTAFARVLRGNRRSVLEPDPDIRRVHGRRHNPPGCHHAG